MLFAVWCKGVCMALSWWMIFVVVDMSGDLEGRRKGQLSNSPLPPCGERRGDAARPQLGVGGCLLPSPLA